MMSVNQDTGITPNTEIKTEEKPPMMTETQSEATPETQLEEIPVMWLEAEQELSFYSAMKIFILESEIPEFQTETLKVILLNYALALLLAIPYPDLDHSLEEFSNRAGVIVFEPILLPKFGYVFRLVTLVVNTLAIIAVIIPNRIFRPCVLPCFLWSIFILTAISENLVEIVWTIHNLYGSFYYLIISIVGVIFFVVQA